MADQWKSPQDSEEKRSPEAEDRLRGVVDEGDDAFDDDDADDLDEEDQDEENTII